MSSETPTSKLLDALKAEFGREVTIYGSMPASISTPSIIVAPGEPFLVNSTFKNGIEEKWNVLVSTKMNTDDRGTDKLRELSLRVRRAVTSIGAIWDSGQQPAIPTNMAGQVETNVLLVSNVVRFKYDCTELIKPPEPELGSS